MLAATWPMHANATWANGRPGLPALLHDINAHATDSNPSFLSPPLSRFISPCLVAFLFSLPCPFPLTTSVAALLLKRLPFATGIWLVLRIPIMILLLVYARHMCVTSSVQHYAGSSHICIPQPFPKFQSQRKVLSLVSEKTTEAIPVA